MALRNQIFHEELYTEHIEESAWLYETRVNWLDDTEVGWLDLEDIDAQIEAHLDALMVGGKKALELVYQQLDDAEPARLHVLVRMLCKHRDSAFFAKIWKTLDLADISTVNAVTDAFKWEFPDEWGDHLVNLFASSRTELFQVLAPSVCYRFRARSKSLIEALEKSDTQDSIILLRSLAVCDRETLGVLQASLERCTVSADPHEKSAALLCRLAKGDAGAVEILRADYAADPMLAAICCDVPLSRALLEHAKQVPDAPGVLLALGTTGNLVAVPFLLSLLDHPELAAQAVDALNMICGANLYTDTHIADEVDEDELFEHEKEPFSQGQLPKNINGDPYGGEIQVLSTDRAQWQDWLEKNKNQFTRGKRYRSGKLFTAGQLVQVLIDNRSSYDQRRYAHLELIVRYGLNMQFATDDLIVFQKRQLNEMYSWAKEIDASSQAGAWYFDNRMTGSG